MQKQLFKNKKSDILSQKYLEKFIEEFEELFGKYLPKEEVIQRIKNNLDNICIGEINEKNILAYYDPDKKTIMIKPDISEEERANSFFHEMIHVITFDGENCGFMREVSQKNIEQQINIKENEEKETYIGTGFNEGFTEYATMIRNMKFGNKKEETGSYRILREAVSNFIKIIGEDEFFEMAFNNPNNLTKILKNTYNLEQHEILQFLENFDKIWEYEEKILGGKIKNMNLFYNPSNKKEDSFELKKAKDKITEIYMKVISKKEISTAKEFSNIYHSIDRLLNELNRGINFEIVELLLEKAKQNINIEEIKNELCDDFQVIEEHLEVKKFINMDEQQKLETLCQNSKMMKLFKKLPEGTQKNYQEKIISELYDNLIKGKGEMIDVFSNGLAQHILKKGYSLDNISITETPCGILSGVYKISNEQEGEMQNTDILFYRKFSEEVSEFRPIITQEERQNIPMQVSSKDLVWRDTNNNIFIEKNNGIRVFIGKGRIDYLEYVRSNTKIPSKKEILNKNFNIKATGKVEQKVEIR